MPSQFRNKGSVIIIVVIIILAIVGVLYFTVNGNKNLGSSLVSKTDSCQGNSYLTVSPTDLSSFSTIPPLGAINPQSEHVIPSDHFGFTLNTTNNGKTIAATVVAPGEVHVDSITKQTVTQNGHINQDYSITFSPCPELNFYYNHLTTISEALQNQMDNDKNSHCQENKQPQLTDTTCRYTINYQAKAGETLGVAGGPGTMIRGFDLGGYDTRTPELAFINKKRPLASPNQYLHTICPLDYFTPDIKKELYARVKNTLKGSDGYPLCGTDMQDIPDTIQGNWYLNPLVNGPDNASQQLAFVHNNEDPSIAEVSYGGTVTNNAGELPYNQMQSGYVNRNPSQVKADGNIYCFYQDNFSLASGTSQQSSGHFIAQLIDSNSLKMEFQNGTCSGNLEFIKPTIYKRIP